MQAILIVGELLLQYGRAMFLPENALGIVAFLVINVPIPYKE